MLNCARSDLPTSRFRLIQTASIPRKQTRTCSVLEVATLQPCMRREVESRRQVTSVTAALNCPTTSHRSSEEFQMKLMTSQPSYTRMSQKPLAVVTRCGDAWLAARRRQYQNLDSRMETRGSRQEVREELLYLQ
jgi:hypothetical protein